MSIRHTAAAVIDAAVSRAGALARRVRAAVAAAPRVRYALFDGYVGAYAEYHRHEYARGLHDGLPPAGAASERTDAAPGSHGFGAGAAPQQRLAPGRAPLAA